MTHPRERMVTSAALLIRERGAQATAIADVLAHSGAPRGSAYHHFPGGRTQLLCEAVDHAGRFVTDRLAAAESSRDAVDTLFDDYRNQLHNSAFRAGCPVVAVAVEAGDPASPQHATAVINRAAVAFRGWQEVLVRLLTSDGVVEDEARDLAAMVLASFEGALVLARASRSVTPMDRVQRQLRRLLDGVTGGSDA